MALVAGTRLGPYEIVAPLGAGGMGEVYRARDSRLKRDVAIKTLPPDVSVDPARRKRFELEARAVAALSHPHIGAIFDVGTDAGVDYLVLELIEGETLANRLRRCPLPLAEALARDREIADAVAAAHRRGIVHRDLKPGNVMLTKTGAKVIDFGLARVIRDEPEAGAAPVLSRAPLAFGPPTRLFPVASTSHVVHPDVKRFLVMVPTAPASATIKVMLNSRGQ